jgi:tRNA threonylcarbamoyl adenosine modification protein YjeE
MNAGDYSDLREYILNWVAPELLEDRPKLLLLSGEMGAGKTTFTVLLAEQLGALEAASPSFALHARYDGPRGTVDHFDLDRLKSAEELESIGFWDLIAEASLDGRRFVVIEWADRLNEFGFALQTSTGSLVSWAKPFRVWNFRFLGSPNWEIVRTNLR